MSLGARKQYPRAPSSALRADLLGAYACFSNMLLVLRLRQSRHCDAVLGHQFTEQRRRAFVRRCSAAARATATTAPPGGAANTERDVERRPPLLVLHIQLGAVVSQVLDDRVRASGACAVEGGLAIRVEGIEIDAVLHAQLDGFERARFR